MCFGIWRRTIQRIQLQLKNTYYFHVNNKKDQSTSFQKVKCIQLEHIRNSRNNFSNRKHVSSARNFIFGNFVFAFLRESYREKGNNALSDSVGEIYLLKLSTHWPEFDPIEVVCVSVGAASQVSFVLAEAICFSIQDDT